MEISSPVTTEEWGEEEDMLRATRPQDAKMRRNKGREKF